MGDAESVIEKLRSVSPEMAAIADSLDDGSDAARRIDLIGRFSDTIRRAEAIHVARTAERVGLTASEANLMIASSGLDVALVLLLAERHPEYAMALLHGIRAVAGDGGLVQLIDRFVEANPL